MRSGNEESEFGEDDKDGIETCWYAINVGQTILFRSINMEDDNKDHNDAINNNQSTITTNDIRAY